AQRGLQHASVHVTAHHERIRTGARFGIIDDVRARRAQAGEIEPMTAIAGSRVEGAPEPGKSWSAEHDLSVVEAADLERSGRHIGFPRVPALHWICSDLHLALLGQVTELIDDQVGVDGCVLERSRARGFSPFAVTREAPAAR